MACEIMLNKYLFLTIIILKFLNIYELYSNKNVSFKIFNVNTLLGINHHNYGKKSTGFKNND